MNKLLITAVGLLALSFSFANHFTPAWWGQNPYMAMNFYVYGAEVLGDQLAANDEIGIFDGSTLVGAVKLTQSINAYASGCVSIIASMAGGGVPGSATAGHPVIVKVWKADTQSEYAYPEMSVQFSWYYGSYNTVFESLDTCMIGMLSYSIPAGISSQYLTPPPNPGGGYVYNVTFPGTGFLLDRIWINNGGGGMMTAYALNTPTLDLSFSGTAPLYVLPYGWFIDKGSISYYATPSYPIKICFDLDSLERLANPAAVLLYWRDIHGTAPFTPVAAIYDSVNGFLCADVTALGEFILASNDPANAHGALEGYVQVEGTLQPIPGADVTLEAYSDVTDEFGQYGFPSLPAGEYEVCFSANGYFPENHTVSIMPAQTLILNVLLEPSGQVPTIPQQLTIQRDEGGFLLNWSDAGQAESYRVYGSSSPYADFLFLATAPGSQIILTDSILISQSLDPEQTFFYVTADSGP